MINEEKIVQYYLNGNSLRETSIKFNSKIYSIFNLLKEKNKLRSRKEALIISNKKIKKRIKFNPCVLDKLGIKEAYFLGLYYSDGCVCHTTHNRYTISFCTIDKDLIDSIKLFFESNNKIKEEKRDNVIVYRLNFCSKHLFDRLVELGCVENKSKIAGPPKIPENLYLPFLLGVFDGNGCLSRNSSINSWKVSIGTASFKFSNWLKEINKDIVFSFEKRTIKSGIFYSIVFTGISAKFFLDRLYKSTKDLVTPLCRKKKLYNCLLTIDFTRGTNFTDWENKILSIKKYSHQDCVDLINSDPRNYGWKRSKDSIAHKRKSLHISDM